MTNFSLLITQGQHACHRMAVGAGALDAINALMARRPVLITVTANKYETCPTAAILLGRIHRAGVEH